MNRGGGPNDNRWIGPFGLLIQALVVSPFVTGKWHDYGGTEKSDLEILGRYELRKVNR